MIARGCLIYAAVCAVAGAWPPDAEGASAPVVFAPRRVLLARAGQSAITLVYGEPDAAVAAALRDGLRETLGATLPMVRDGDMLAPGAWQLAEEWAGKSLLVLGNIHTNRAVLPLYARRLVGASAGYPGPGRYELRTLFAPLRRNVDMIFVGGSDAAGLEAGIRRLLQLVGSPEGKRDGALPRTLELGSAGGRGVPPSNSLSVELADSVAAYYWYGNVRGAQRARDMVLGELEKQERGLWGFLQGGHYNADRYFRAVRQLAAVGLFGEDTQRRIDERLVQIALETRDGYMGRAAAADSERINRGLDRHQFAGVISQFILLEYLDQIGEVPEGFREEVRAAHRRVRGHIESFIQLGRYQANREGKEGLDCVTGLADLYLQAGDERLIQRGVFRLMADFYVASVDNLGCQIGQDSYITARPGEQYAGTSGGLGLLAAAYFHRDGEYRWLYENLKRFAFYCGNSFHSRFPPEMLSLPPEVASAPPRRYVGVSVVPMDPWTYEALKVKEVPEAVRPIEAPFETLFSKAVFRDGGTADDAFLILQGVNRGAQDRSDGFQGNTIVRYTELGSILLFGNTQRETSWSRSVVSASRGERDPQTAACVLESSFRTPAVSGLRSRLPHDGGVAWTRSIFRRHGGYFVVLDEMMAGADDIYHFTCRWRSYHPGETDGGRGFQATDGQNGTVLRIISSEALPQGAILEPRDGAIEPMMLRRWKDARLAEGKSASFQSLLYASNDAVGRNFDVRRAGSRTALVKGICREFAELAILGTDGFGPVQAAASDGRLTYLSEHGLAASDARKLSLPGRLRLEASDAFHVFLAPDGGPATLQNPHAQPIEVAIHCDPSTTAALDSRPLDGESRVRLEPGDHSLQVSGLAAFFGEAKAELSGLWDNAGDPDQTQPAAHTAPRTPHSALPLAESWRYQGILPPLHKHGLIRASSEPAPTFGTPDRWVDRCTNNHPEQTSAGWAAGIEGAAILDLHEVVEIDSLRIIGEMNAFREGDMAFEVVLGSDGFAADQRRIAIPAPRFETYYHEMQQYMYTYQFPVHVLPVGQKARQVKILGRWREKKAPISYHEIEVVTTARRTRAPVRLLARDFLGEGRPGLLATSGDRLVMLSPQGERLWEQELESPLACLNVADVNADGKLEVIAFTLAEKLHVYNADGTCRFVHDVRQGKVGGSTPLRPACVGAWRPDARGFLEYCFFPHVIYGRVSAEPDLKQHVTPSQGAWGGKHVFTMPDVSGDGIEELVIVGEYGLRLAVVDSRSDVENGKFTYLAKHPLTGYSAGNDELPLYHDGAVVRDAKGHWLGLVAVNPGGVDYFAAPDIRPAWKHFNHPSNTCFCLHDLTGDGVPAILVGREDGFLTAYAAADGRVVRKAYIGREVRALAVGGRQIAVGTSEGLALLDEEFRVVGFQPGNVQALGVLEASVEGVRRLAVALDDGTITALER